MILRRKFIDKIKPNSILLGLIFFCIGGNAQINLVSNPSFEYHTTCNINPGGIKVAYPWYSPVNDTNYAFTYFNSCSLNPCCTTVYLGGNQTPKSGNGFAGGYFCWSPKGGVARNTRNYLQTKLINTLQKNHCYYIEFYALLDNTSKWAINNIALFISDTAIWNNSKVNSNGLILAIPQIELFGNTIINDSINWTRVAGIYTSDGVEKYITIGNFKDDSLLSYINIKTPALGGGTSYNIDDVSVIPLDSMQLKAEAGRDTTIVKGDSVWIGSRLCGLTNVVWYDAYNNVIDTGVPGMWVKPTTNTFYVIEQNVCGQYSRDTVNVAVAPMPVTLLSFKVSGFKSFNGNTNTVLSWETSSEVNVSYFNVQRSVDGETFETVGMVKSKGASKYSFIDNTNLSGVVYYRLEVVDKNGSKSYSEIRVLSIGNNKEILVYPNPSMGIVNIQLPIKGYWLITATDQEGRIVWEQQCKGCSGVVNHNFSNAKGLYFIKIINSDTGQQTVQKVNLQ